MLVSRTLKNWRQELDVVAAALGAEDKAAALIREYDERVARLKGEINLPPNPVAVFYLSGERPFILYPTSISIRHRSCSNSWSP